MRITMLLLLLICIVSKGLASDSVKSNSDFNMHFRTNGLFSIGAHLYGKPKYGDLGPGYRSDIMINSTLVSYKELAFDFLMAASTSIARLPKTPIKMDKIRYIITPTLRYSLTKSVFTGSLYHQCIHTLSREEKEDGSTWWNAIQVGWGTKGAYSNYFIQKYNNRDFSLRNSFDVTINAGYYLHGKAALIGNNHDYVSDLSGLIRYHFGIFRNRTIFIDTQYHLWYDRSKNTTLKILAEVNYVILAFENIATVYFSHCIIDQNRYDNEYSLGSLGVKILF
ncbi:MAG: hypothetical protein JW915_17815 [Chitinispirillaceae bacterium]|nr:hypothetical protein [Chitinispirillaceae bacterium]